MAILAVQAPAAERSEAMVVLFRMPTLWAAFKYGSHQFAPLPEGKLFTLSSYSRLQTMVMNWALESFSSGPNFPLPMPETRPSPAALSM